MRTAQKTYYHSGDRPINPRPGLVLMLFLSLPYLTNRIDAFPRSQLHDYALGLLAMLFWMVIFRWESIRKRFPMAQVLLESFLGFLLISGLLALFGTVYYLLLFA
jgi:hypothetical protein